MGRRPTDSETLSDPDTLTGRGATGDRPPEAGLAYFRQQWRDSPYWTNVAFVILSLHALQAVIAACILLAHLPIHAPAVAAFAVVIFDLGLLWGLSALRDRAHVGRRPAWLIGMALLHCLLGLWLLGATVEHKTFRADIAHAERLKAALETGDAERLAQHLLALNNLDHAHAYDHAARLFLSHGKMSLAASTLAKTFTAPALATARCGAAGRLLYWASWQPSAAVGTDPRLARLREAAAPYMGQAAIQVTGWTCRNETFANAIRYLVAGLARMPGQWIGFKTTGLSSLPVATGSPK